MYTFCLQFFQCCLDILDSQAEPRIPAMAQHTLLRNRDNFEQNAIDVEARKRHLAKPA